MNKRGRLSWETIKVVLFFGGFSSERNISLDSARTFYDSIREVLVQKNLFLVYVAPNRKFYLIKADWIYCNTIEDFEILLERSTSPRSTGSHYQSYADFKGIEVGYVLSKAALRALVREADVLVPLIHGKWGEDGWLTQYLQKLGHYAIVGSSEQSLSDSYDKERSKKILAQAGFQVPFGMQIALRTHPEWQLLPATSSGNRNAHVNQARMQTLKKIQRFFLLHQAKSHAHSHSHSKIASESTSRSDAIQLNHPIHPIHPNKSKLSSTSSASSALSTSYEAGDERHTEHARIELVVKPNTGGSSDGVSLVTVDDLAGLERAILDAFSYSAEVLVEVFVVGREFSIIVFEQNRHYPVAFLPTEIVPDTSVSTAKAQKSTQRLSQQRLSQKSHQKAQDATYKATQGQKLYTRQKKYMPQHQTEHHTPARFSKRTLKTIMDQSGKVFKLFNMEDWGRLDGFLVADGTIVWTEVNGIPGYGMDGLLFQQSTLWNISSTHLSLKLIDNALAKTKANRSAPQPTSQSIQNTQNIESTRSDAKNTATTLKSPPQPTTLDESVKKSAQMAPTIMAPILSTSLSTSSSQPHLKSTELASSKPTSSKPIKPIETTKTTKTAKSRKTTQNYPNRLRIAVLGGGETSERQVSRMSWFNVIEKLSSLNRYSLSYLFMDRHRSIWKVPRFLTLKHTVEEIEYILYHPKKYQQTLRNVHSLKPNVLPSVLCNTLPPAKYPSYPLNPLNPLNPLYPLNPPLEESDSHNFIPYKITLEELVGEIDFCFIALHGGIGENGTLQKQLTRLKIPFNGSLAAASALSSDKYRTQQAIIKLTQKLRIPKVTTAKSTVISTQTFHKRLLAGGFTEQTLSKLIRATQQDITTVDQRFPTLFSQFEHITAQLLTELKHTLASPNGIVLKPRREGCSTGVWILKETSSITNKLTKKTSHIECIPISRQATYYFLALLSALPAIPRSLLTAKPIKSVQPIKQVQRKEHSLEERRENNNKASQAKSLESIAEGIAEEPVTSDSVLEMPIPALVPSLESSELLESSLPAKNTPRTSSTRTFLAPNSSKYPPTNLRILHPLDILCESIIEGADIIEMTVGVLEKNNRIIALLPSETVAKAHVLTLDEKFHKGIGINLTPPPNLSPRAVTTLRRKIARLAKELNLRGYARIDVFYNLKTEGITVIEINTLPGLTVATVLYTQALLTPQLHLKPADFLSHIIHERLKSH